MERIFWVKCPKCAGRFCCDYELRHSDLKLICPFCQEQFFDVDSPEIDERL
ncbi:MAG TPA: hypothetical protein GXZ24_03575 [Firmicutes bacterium]|jgi:hypothetical protein|nr:hypothetical protein [Bacillota bacterium]